MRNMNDIGERLEMATAMAEIVADFVAGVLKRRDRVPEFMHDDIEEIAPKAFHRILLSIAAFIDLGGSRDSDEFVAADEVSKRLSLLLHEVEKAKLAKAVDNVIQLRKWDDVQENKIAA